MRILVTGAGGQVGYELARSLMTTGSVCALSRAQCDLASDETLRATVATHAPDVIVNAAAYTAVDRAEHDEALALRINGEAPGTLALLAREHGALLIHYSTDYVFDGSKAGAWTEADAVAPLNVYGRTKLRGEQAIAESGCDFLILRTSWVFAARGRNFLTSMLRLGREREQLGIIDDQVGAPTWARNIADATARIVDHAQGERARGDFVPGVFNLASRGETSWHGFAQRIFAQVRARRGDAALRVGRVDPIATAEYPTAARRPLNSRLDGRAVAARFSVEMPHWDDALARCLEDLDCQEQP